MQSENDYESVVQQRDALEKKLADMAAENAELKKFGDTLFEMSKSLNGTGVGIQGNYEVACQQLGIDAAIDAFNEIETPVTDAYLALIKSEAQSEVIEWLDAEITAIDTMYRGDPSYEHDAYWMKSEVLDVVELARKAFSDQLRKGINDAQ